MTENIAARIVADSINPHGKRLTSFILTYPRMIHSEIMTHRVFSRNAASSRAIPVEKMIKAVEANPAQFVFWGKNKPGMQAGEQLSSREQSSAMRIIQFMRDGAVDGVEELVALGLHKQNANRYLEPFGHITVLVTSCDWENFFALRVHKDAQPEFQQLATLMAVAWLGSLPEVMSWGGWHIPKFAGDPLNNSGLNTPICETALKVATARCARLSYLTFDGEHDPAKDVALHDSLLANGHLSPFEHCAQAIETEFYPWSNYDQPTPERDCPPRLMRIRGLSHWQQYRKQFHQERQTISREDLQARINARPDWISL